MKELSVQQQAQEEEYFFPYHYLDLYLDSFKNFYYIQRESLIKKVKKILKLKKSDLILDACCGDGRFSYELKKEGFNVVGVDYSKRAIDFARIFNQDSKNFYASDLKKFSYPKKFDKIILMESLEHFPPKEIPLFLKALNNLLKKNGLLVVTGPSKKLKLQKKHYQHFSPEHLRKVLEDNFEVHNIYGYSYLGKGRMFYDFLETIGKLIIPFQRFGFVKKYFKILKKGYDKKFALGESRNSKGLIAVCIKK